MQENVIKKVLFDEKTIKQRVSELGDEITRYYKDLGVSDIVVICVLNGAVIFFSDLIRYLDLDIVLDFTRVKSYGDNVISSGQISIIKDIEINIKGKHVLLVEDIIDSGVTLNQLVKVLYSREPASIRTCAFLDKTESRTTNFELDFKGFEVPNEFVVGYGLDYAGMYRQFPFIAILDHQVYSK